MKQFLQINLKSTRRWCILGFHFLWDLYDYFSIRGSGVGEVITDKGAFLKGLDEFDYLEFGVSSKDARLMNISTRKLIEHTFLALLDSSIDYRGKNIGCYMAGVAHDLWMLSGEVSVAIISTVG